MKNLASLLAASALGAALIAGCSKSAETSSSATASSATSGSHALVTGVTGDAEHGKAIFDENCQACHGAAGAGGIGPSLKGEKARKDFNATVAWIKNPAPPMPKLYPEKLKDADVADVAAYVQSL
jgi:mono/diheme cytochrome c family protein